MSTVNIYEHNVENPRMRIFSCASMHRYELLYFLKEIKKICEQNHNQVSAATMTNEAKRIKEELRQKKSGITIHNKTQLETLKLPILPFQLTGYFIMFLWTGGFIDTWKDKLVNSHYTNFTIDPLLGIICIGIIMGLVVLSFKELIIYDHSNKSVYAGFSFLGFIRMNVHQVIEEAECVTPQSLADESRRLMTTKLYIMDKKNNGNKVTLHSFMSNWAALRKGKRIAKKLKLPLYGEEGLKCYDSNLTKSIALMFDFSGYITVSLFPLLLILISLEDINAILLHYGYHFL